MRTPDWQTEDGRVQLYCGDCLEILPTLEAGSVDAVVTDPPYSSGGAFRGDRANGTVAKYVQTESQVHGHYQEFSGDNRDQRSFLVWCTLWMIAARRATRPGGVICSFSDWRQVPVLTDAIQAAGWVWRNLATWWKPGCRMQKGRFSSSAEYVVYGTNGPHDSEDGEGVQNVFSCMTLRLTDKEHIAEKPRPVAEWVTSPAKRGGVILDPFMGSGAFGAACVASGRRFIGIDCDCRSFELSIERISDELNRLPLFEDKPKIVQRSLEGVA